MRKTWVCLVALALAASLAACSDSNDSNGDGGPGTGGTGAGGTGGEGGEGGGGDPLAGCTKPMPESVDPEEGGINQVVKVIGRCFNPDLTKNSIYFSGASGFQKAVVSGVSPDGTQLQTKVPPGAVEGTIEVETDWGQGPVRMAGPYFVVTGDSPPPVITGLTPAVVNAGTDGIANLVVSGQGFTRGTRVFIDDTELEASYSSYTMVTAVVPAEHLTSVGMRTIRAVNDPPGGGTSERTLEVVEPLHVVSVSAVASRMVRVTFERDVKQSSIERSDFSIRVGPNTLRIKEAKHWLGRSVNLETFAAQTPNVTYTVTVEDIVAEDGGLLDGTYTGDFRGFGSDPIPAGVFGKQSCGGDGLHGPLGISSAGNYVFVTEQTGHQVQRVLLDGTFSGYFGTDSAGTRPIGLQLDDATAYGCGGTSASLPNTLNNPKGSMIVASDGKKYLADTQNDRVIQLKSDDTLLKADFATRLNTGIERPVLLGIRGGKLWIASKDDKIYRISTDGTPNGSTLLGSGTSREQAHFLTGGDGAPAMAFSTAAWYVLDPGNHRLLRFAADTNEGEGYIGAGAFGTFKLTPPACGTEATPEGGAPACAGTDAGQFTNPNGLAMDSSGTLWVTDEANGGRLQRFTSGGAFIVAYDLGYMPGGVAVDRDDAVWVVDRTNDQVHRYTY